MIPLSPAAPGTPVRDNLREICDHLGILVGVEQAAVEVLGISESTGPPRVWAGHPDRATQSLGWPPSPDTPSEKVEPEPEPDVEGVPEMQPDVQDVGALHAGRTWRQLEPLA
eukprot:SAG25_NODE_10425_length_335_cov_0.733051_1_plen_111_part_11